MIFDPTTPTLFGLFPWDALAADALKVGQPMPLRIGFRCGESMLFGSGMGTPLVLSPTSARYPMTLEFTKSSHLAGTFPMASFGNLRQPSGDLQAPNGARAKLKL